MENVNTENAVTLTFNTVKLAKKGKGVKDEFYTANLIGKQDLVTKLTRKGEAWEDREVTYDHLTPEHYDLLVEQVEKIEDAKAKVILMAKAIDSYLAEKARESSNPVQTLATLILEEGKLTKDSEKARQIAQSLTFQAKSNGLDIADVYEMTCVMVEKKAAKEKAALEALKPKE